MLILRGLWTAGKVPVLRRWGNLFNCILWSNILTWSFHIKTLFTTRACNNSGVGLWIDRTKAKMMKFLTLGLVAKTPGQDIGDLRLTGYFCAAFCHGLYAIYFQVSPFSLFIHLSYLNTKLFVYAPHSASLLTWGF